MERAAQNSWEGEEDDEWPVVVRPDGLGGVRVQGQTFEPRLDGDGVVDLVSGNGVSGGRLLQRRAFDEDFAAILGVGVDRWPAAFSHFAGDGPGILGLVVEHDEEHKDNCVADPEGAIRHAPALSGCLRTGGHGREEALRKSANAQSGRVVSWESKHTPIIIIDM